MSFWTVVPIRARRSEERPTDSGLDEGKSWADAAAIMRAPAASDTGVLRFMVREGVSGGQNPIPGSAPWQHATPAGLQRRIEDE
jgi:hypothetical protein